MKKTHKYLCLLLVGLAQINGKAETLTGEDYSKMSTNELGKALVAAVNERNLDTIKELIQAGANINQEITYTFDSSDMDGVSVTRTILEYVSLFGYVDILKILTQAGQIDGVDKALICAAEEGDADVVRELVRMPDSGNSKRKYLSEALITAVQSFPYNPDSPKGFSRRALKNYIGVVRLLIEAGADVNYIDNLGRTPLIKIVSSSPKTEAQNNQKAEIIQVLLRAGANINHADKEGDVALMVAIKNHDFDLVQILLQIPEININYVNDAGNTPLVIAVQCIQYSYISGRTDQYNDCINSQKIVEKLLTTPGINPLHINKKGDTAINLLQEKAAAAKGIPASLW